MYCEPVSQKAPILGKMYCAIMSGFRKSGHKWISLLHHVTDEHQWLDGECEHEALTGTPTDHDGKDIPYFSKDESAFRALQKLVLDKRWIKSLCFYTKFRYVL